jgi:hypothetical protein
VRLPAAFIASILAVAFSIPASAADTAPLEQDVINRYLGARQTQQELMKGAQMEVEIEGRLPKLEKQGRLKVLRSISKLGQITFKTLDAFTGDNAVKQELITRYLTAEADSGGQAGSMAVSPDNYKFKLKATLTQGNSSAAIFEVTPKKKRIGLFKGELWIDIATGMPLREAGRWVKNPSVLLKRIDFVQEYELKNGVSIPKHRETKMDVRVFGRAELSMAFSNFTRPENTDAWFAAAH